MQNTAWILDPASSKHLSSNRDAGVDQNVCPIESFQNLHLLGFKLLKDFINHLLSAIRHDNPSTEIPNADCWDLKGNEDGFY
jgi:hypothetical protein